GNGDLLGYRFRQNAIWDMRTQRKVQTDPSGGSDWLGCFSPDGRLVATLSYVNGRARLTLWERESGKVLSENELSVVAHPGNLMPIYISRDGRRFVGWTLNVHEDGIRYRFLICDASTGQRWLEVDDPDVQENHAVSPDARLLALPLRDGWVAIWDLDANE